MDRRRRRRVSRASKTIYIKQLKTYFPIHFSNVSDRANTKTTANKKRRDGGRKTFYYLFFLRTFKIYRNGESPPQFFLLFSLIRLDDSKFIRSFFSSNNRRYTVRGTQDCELMVFFWRIVDFFLFFFAYELFDLEINARRLPRHDFQTNRRNFVRSANSICCREVQNF